MNKLIDVFDTRALYAVDGDPQAKKFFSLVEAIVRSGKAIPPGTPGVEVKIVEVGQLMVPLNVTLTTNLGSQLIELWCEKITYDHMEHWSHTFSSAVTCSVHAVITHLGLDWKPLHTRQQSVLGSVMATVIDPML